MAGPRTRNLVIGGLVVVLLAGAAFPVTYFLRERADRRRMHAAADSFAAAWRDGQLETVGYAGATGTDVAQQAAAVTAGLTSAAEDRPAVVDVLAVDPYRGNRATERLKVRWDLGRGRRWEYETAVDLVRGAGAWQVTWAPSAVHPKLVAGQVLTTTRVRAERGEILGSGGQVLVTARPVVMVGIEPGRTTDRRATAAAVAAVVDVDAAALTQRVLAASPTSFVDVITLRRADYDAVKSRLKPVPGTVFRETTLSLAPSATFARPVLGIVGLATAELVKASGGRVQAGDVTGLSGVQRRYDARLSGTAGYTVTAGPPAGAAATAGAAVPPTITLQSLEPVAGRSVQLSLDESAQRVAETVMASAPKPAGLVAIRPSTGEVLAVANGPANAAGYNRALIGRYPPGSTFKIATTYALLEDGLTPGTPVACPPTVNVGGRVFKNAEDETLGSVPFSTDFAESCNTAFVGLSRQVTQNQLFDAATVLGYGRPNLTGVDAFMGSMPRTGDAVAHAADSIGQGTVLASPLTVASVSASIASGKYLPPRIVLDPAATADGAPGDTATGTPTSEGAGDTATGTDGTDATPAESASPAPSPAGTPLSAETIARLRTLTGLVVTNGTGTALKAVPGQPVHGKTGTAEFGNANPPATHAWFTGYQGDIAFAIVVEGGGFGGEVAAPLAAAFLTALA